MVKTALITGAGRGLGKELALAFKKAGFRVLDHIRTMVPGDSYHHIYGDLRDSRTINRIRTIVGEQLSVLVNCAGVYLDDRHSAPDRIEEVIQVNALAPILLTRTLWPALSASRGVVLNIGSISGLYGSKNESVYSASKRALAAFSNGLQAEASGVGIRVIHADLGAMRTDMMAHRGDWVSLIDPAEVADYLVQLCANSPSSFSVTNIEIKRRISQ